MKKLIFAGLICSANIANAQYANIEGKFESKVTSLDLIALDTESGVIAASTTVVQGPCSGTIAGIGKMSGNVLNFSPYVKVTETDSCSISVTFDKKRDAALIKGKGCSAYSGAACGWEGDTVKRIK
jgi:hypothetical protein